MVDCTPPTYQIIQNANHDYQIDVQIEVVTSKTLEETLNEEAKKDSLFAIAYIQKLASLGNKEAKGLQTIYQAYCKFMETRDKKAFLLSCDFVVNNNKPGTLAYDLAKYIQAILNHQAIDSKLDSVKVLANHLIPDLEKTLIMPSLKVPQPSQEVIIPEIKANHLAFPDIIKYEGDYYISFREATSHAKFDDFGKIRILKGHFQKMSKQWQFQNAGLISKEAYDLRDPKFFVDGSNVLHLIIGGSKINEKDETTSMVPHVAKLQNKEWFLQEAIVDPAADSPVGQWIWKVTWNPYDNQGYGLSYGKKPTLDLMKTADGLHFNKIAELAAEPLTDLSEATIRFKKDGTAVALIRTRRNGIIAKASAKSGYTDWSYHIIPFRIGGPDFVISENEQKMWTATRHFFLNEDNTIDEATIIALMDEQSLTPLLRLPSQFDNSYPGVVLEPDGTLTIVYYSGQSKEISRIYITCISVD